MGWLRLVRIGTANQARGPERAAEKAWPSERSIPATAVRAKGPTTDGIRTSAPGPAQEAARALWDSIEDKRPTKPENVILAINAIRTPWFIQTAIVEAFRRQYGQDARQVGFREIWVVGPNETLTERLNIDSGV